MGLTRRRMSRTGAAPGSLWQGVYRLGYVGGTLRPVGNGSQVHLGYGLDHTAQVLVQADSDGEADPLAPA